MKALFTKGFEVIVHILISRVRYFIENFGPYRKSDRQKVVLLPQNWYSTLQGENAQGNVLFQVFKT